MIKYDKTEGVTRVKLSRLEMIAILATDLTGTIDYEREMLEELGEPEKHDRGTLKSIRMSALSGWTEGGYCKSGGFSTLSIRCSKTNMNLYIEFVPYRDVHFDSDEDGMHISVFKDDSDDLLYESDWDVPTLDAEGLLKEKNA